MTEPLEIERKFLVDQKIWQPGEQGISVRQGYLAGEGPLLVRIRQQDRKAFLTLKGRTTGISRLEFEYEIPMVDAVGLLRLCQQPLVEKVRYVEEFEGHTWEIDRFFGSNEGLMIAEIELTSEDESFARPAWLGREVSGDSRYYNSNLIQHPYSEWKDGA